MDNITVLVLADPSAPALRKLDGIGSGVNVRIGKTVDALGDAVGDARVLFNWTGSKPDVRRVMELAPKLEWIHAMYAGLDRSLFPELVESPIPLTNGSGVFSQSLGEFVILGILYFAKNVPRRMQAKAEHRWDVFDNVENQQANSRNRGARGHRPGGGITRKSARHCGCWPCARDPSPARGETSMWTASTPRPIFTRCFPNAIMWRSRRH